MRTVSEPTIVRGADWLERIARFRVTVWRAEGMLNETFFNDGRCLEDIDYRAIQVVVTDAGRLVGAIRYFQYASLAECPCLPDPDSVRVTIPTPVATPERMVVDPVYKRQGISRALGRAVRALCYRHGARCMLSECVPEIAADHIRRGRVSLGMAPPDPRFPGIPYEWILSLVDLDDRPDDLPDVRESLEQQATSMPTTAENDGSGQDS